MINAPAVSFKILMYVMYDHIFTINSYKVFMKVEFFSTSMTPYEIEIRKTQR